MPITTADFERAVKSYRGPKKPCAIDVLFSTGWRRYRYRDAHRIPWEDANAARILFSDANSVENIIDETRMTIIKVGFSD